MGVLSLSTCASTASFSTASWSIMLRTTGGKEIQRAHRGQNSPRAISAPPRPPPARKRPLAHHADEGVTPRYRACFCAIPLRAQHVQRETVALLFRRTENCFSIGLLCGCGWVGDHQQQRGARKGLKELDETKLMCRTSC